MANDHITAAFGYADHFPLGRACGRVDAEAEPASVRRPFGLRLAESRQATASVDHAGLGYDETRQIGLALDCGTGEFLPLARHTDGQTGTVTNADGHQGRDSDTDHRED